MSLRRSRSLAIPILLLLVLSSNACTPEATETPEATATTLTPTATEEPPTSLTVCLGQEPLSLFPLNNPSTAARTVLAALYDGPIDTIGYAYQAVILETIPSLENGDAELFQVGAYVGDEVVNADGMPVTLQAGVRIRPAGCRSDDCAIEYDGKSEVQMDQMAVTFRLLPDLRWSDGEALTAQDSVYSFQVAKEIGTSFLASRTQAYEAADDLTVQWWGRPGYIDPTYPEIFFFPLPEHLWGSLAVDELADSDTASRNPAGWGAYVIEEWVAGEEIRLVKNLHYFRHGEGLPAIDVLTFRFTPDPDQAVSALLAGECDVIDASVPVDGLAGLLLSLEEQGELQALFAQQSVMEQLAFGIKPAEYDNGYNPAYDRPDFFSDQRVRQAVAMCIDRQAIVDEVLMGLSSVPASYVPTGHPLFDPAVEAIPYDPTAAALLLEQAGWRDLDGVPGTPRQAWGIPNLTSGMLFSISYLTSGAAQRLQVSSLVVEGLGACGIEVNLEFLDQTELYMPGPEGPLFGRAFDLAEYAMGSTGLEPPCEWYTSDEIPAEGNDWVGTNLSGFSDPLFDRLCAAARQSLPDETAYSEAYRDAQQLFTEELPALPLYWRVRAAAARPEICGLVLDGSASSLLWNIESLEVDADCAP